ncbi:hypothetical protein FOA52_012407 [Chlamydomonas sp. UWO 241]|nr:hypothetical protein FOA52_012407 [Chlamydomonas sp. UWO 241]
MQGAFICKRLNAGFKKNTPCNTTNAPSDTSICTCPIGNFTNAAGVAETCTVCGSGFTQTVACAATADTVCTCPAGLVGV